MGAKIKTILLTGATGFLGSYLTRHFYHKYQLIILKRSFSNTYRIADIMPNVISYDIDITSLENIYAEHRIDYIVHTAINYGRDLFPFSKIIEDNLLFPMRLLELAILHGVSCFINTDTFFAKSQHSYSFLKEYVLTKRQLIDWLKVFSERISIINIRLEHMYGPSDGCKKFIPQIIQRLLANENAIDITDGQQKRDFVYVEDVVDAYKAVIMNGCRVKNGFLEIEVGTGKAVKLKQVIKLIKKFTKSNCLLNFGAVEHRKGEIMHSQADIRNLERLGWRARISLEEGIKKTIEYERIRCHQKRT